MKQSAQKIVARPELPSQAPVVKRSYAEIFDKIVMDSQRDPASYVKNWVVPGGAE